MSKQWLGIKPYVEYTSATGGTQAVTYDATGGGATTPSSSNSNSANITWSHTAVGGSNCVVVVGLMVGASSASAGTFTRSVTYGGVSMTSSGAYADTSVSSGWVETYYLQNPPSGAQTVSATVSKASTSFGRVAGNSVSYNNVGSIGISLSGNTSTSTTWSSIRSMWAAFNSSLAGTMLVAILGIDSSQTISSFAITNSLIGSLPLPPVQGPTTRFTGNSGAAASMTSYVIGDSPGTPYAAYQVTSASAAYLSGSMICLNPVGTAVPTGIHGVWLTMIGAGGGGGSGRQGLSSSTRTGGDAGGGGALVTERYIPVSQLGSTYSVYVPPQASGGAAQATASTNGNQGARALDVLFSSGNTDIVCSSGDGGQPGAAAVWTNFTGGGYTGDALGYGAYGGDATTAVGDPGVAGMWGDANSGAGGGAGGSMTATTASNGGAGGDNREMSLVGGAAGTTAGGVPGSGNAAIAGILGSGAGGGASSNTANGQSGASATGYGGGGGGGGASTNGHASGAGGNGGPAYVRIMWDYR